MRTRKIIVTVILGLLIAAVIALYLWGILGEGKPYTENLSKCVLLIVASVISLIRIHTGQGRVSLSAYEKHFEKELHGAFRDDPASRRRLVKAVAYYCQDRYRTSLKILAGLHKKCKTYEDRHTVTFFTALVYGDAGMVYDAIEAYNHHLQESPRNSTALSNLGLQYMKIGEMGEAAECYLRAIEADPENPYPYNNLASVYYREDELEGAITYAAKALELKSDMYQAASLLAMIYAARNETELWRKYYRIAVANGQNADELSARIKELQIQTDGE